MSKQSEYVRKYFLQREITQKEVADRIGMNTSSLNNMLTGGRPFSKNVAAKLAQNYGFSIAYLLLGIEPEMSVTPTVDQSHNEGAIVNGDNNGRISIDATYAALRAENARLKDEVAWLRSELAKRP